MGKYVKLDETWFIQILLLGICVFSTPSWAYLFVAFSSIALFSYSIRNTKKQLDVRKKLVDIEVKYEEYNQTFQTVRKERHDYLKHIAAIQYLLENEQSQEAKRYIADLVGGYEETNLSIKGEHGAVAAILHRIYQRAREANIAINYDFEVPCSKLPLSSQEIVALLGNILENALDACLEWQQHHSAQGFIEVTLQKRSGLYILICKNSTIPLPKEVADPLFQTTGITTKSKHDGLGTSIIRTIVKQHQGYFDFTAEKEMFTLICKFPSIHM